MADNVKVVLANINSEDSRWARHIALWHCNLLRFGHLMMRQEDEADHPIGGDARNKAESCRSSDGSPPDERTAGV